MTIEQKIVLDNVNVLCKTENGNIKDVISIRIEFDAEKVAYLEKNKDGNFQLNWRYNEST